MFKKRANNKNTDPWEKYTCAEKEEEEKLDDLLSAAKQGRNDVIKILLEANTDLNAVSEKEKSCQGLSALHAAVRHNHTESVQLLLHNGADCNQPDNFGFIPVLDASLNGNYECLLLILQNQQTQSTLKGLEEEGLQHISPMFYVVQQNHEACVDLLKDRTEPMDDVIRELCTQRGVVGAGDKALANPKPVNLREEQLMELLNNTAICGNIATYEWLKTATGGSLTKHHLEQALLTASKHGWLKYMIKMLEEGADINARNPLDNSTPLHAATRYSHLECIEYLVAEGADQKLTDGDGWPPIHIAVRQGNDEAITKLHECKCDVNLQAGPNGDTPLHLALKIPSEDEVVKAILTTSPDITIKDNKGNLPTQVEIPGDLKNLKKMLMQYATN